MSRRIRRFAPKVKCNPDEMLAAVIEFKRDHETLDQLLRTVWVQLRFLKKDVLLPRNYPRAEREKAYRTYAANRKLFVRIARLVENATEAHEKILAAARESAERSKYGIRKLFDLFILKVKRLLKEQDVIGLWFIDVQVVLAKISENANVFQQLAIA